MSGIQGALNWRNCVTWLLKRVSTPSEPLTSARLRTMIQSALDEDKASATESTNDDPTALTWTKEWSDRLQQLDIDRIMSTAGVALDEHAQADHSRTPSKLSNWQEIDIPNYAPLLEGEVAVDGTVKFTGGAIQPAGSPVAAPAASPPAPPPAPAAAAPRRADAHFKPDAIVYPRTIEEL
jgi:hypothetical protein